MNTPFEHGFANQDIIQHNNVVLFKFTTIHERSYDNEPPLYFSACRFYQLYRPFAFNVSPEHRGNVFGRVVDEAGKPIANLRLALPAFRVTTPQDQDEPVFLPSQQGETNEVGEFSISDITSPSVKLMLLPQTPPDYELRSAKIEGMTFYVDQYHTRFGGLTFAIVPGGDVKM